MDGVINRPSSQVVLLRDVTSGGKVIGRGSYGRVIEVYVHGTLCAAKEVHSILVEGVTPAECEATSRSFLTECSNASRLHHPNVVQVLGIYYPTPEAKLPWLVMEMMENSLTAFLEKYERGKLPLHIKLSILVDISQGMEFLHGQDIIHRDLSSNNVLLTKHCVAKIGDFGVAKCIQHNKMKTQTQVPGMLHFMPPEVLSVRPRYGKPVDVFSLGCIACHVMSHQWPEPKDLLPEDSMTARTEVQRREDYLLSCAEPLKQLVKSCLHNKPDLRPDILLVCSELKRLKASLPFAMDDCNNQLMNLSPEKQKLSKDGQNSDEADAVVQGLKEQIQKSLKSLSLNKLSQEINCHPQPIMPVIPISNSTTSNKEKNRKGNANTAESFLYLQQLGWDPVNGTFDSSNIDVKWKKLFEAVGITENNLMDIDVAKLICEYVVRHGGIENVIRQPEHGLSSSPLQPANIDRLPLSSKSEGSPMTPSVLLHNNEEQPPPPHEGWRDNPPSQYGGQELPPPPGWGHPPPGWDHPPPPPPHGGWEHPPHGDWIHPPPLPPHRGWRHHPPPPHHGWRHPPPHHRGHPPPHHRRHPPPPHWGWGPPHHHHCGQRRPHPPFHHRSGRPPPPR
ncbi:serine/threonine-protein kinase TNNI3K-like [Dysidea avara]|uniref:serine/threonine-protein kinase TNNI3K-like n=1 Tax=Dysidea avara TaxID=196820 RepID=UPI0033318D8A